MAIEIKVPTIGESVTEVEVGAWLKRPGDPIQKDEPLVSLESEKATVDLPAPEGGTLSQVLKQKGEVAKVGEVIAYLESAGATGNPPVAAGGTGETTDRTSKELAARAQSRVMPAAERALAERGLRAEEVQATGPGGRLLKEDVLKHSDSSQAESATVILTKASVSAASATPEKPLPGGAREEEVVPMSRLRRTVAERLVEAQRNAALLTTVNEIDMANVMALRKQYGDAFHQRYNVKLGFMSFFVKATVDALRLFPVVNAEIRGTNIVYHNYYDLGVAVGSGKGLVVPVLRNAERMSFAEVEMAIADFGKRAKENKLKLEELQGGTFTISNGGVYGSLLSTPIVNPPQSGVLGMHAIQDRPVALDGQVVIRPMMYIALTYDHRLVDGREAVSFLKRIKEVIESPARMLMEI